MSRFLKSFRDYKPRFKEGDICYFNPSFDGLCKEAMTYEYFSCISSHPVEEGDFIKESLIRNNGWKSVQSKLIVRHTHYFDTNTWISKTDDTDCYVGDHVPRKYSVSGVGVGGGTINFTMLIPSPYLSKYPPIYLDFDQDLASIVDDSGSKHLMGINSTGLAVGQNETS